MRIALYQPDIPQNTGTILRLAACLGVGVDIIGPAGFDMTDRTLRRAGMDYLNKIKLERHQSWESFCADQSENDSHEDENGYENRLPNRAHHRRLILLTTAASQSYLEFEFAPSDTLLLGRESAGVPELVHKAADASVTIPMRSGFRSLNIAVACSMVLGEALRQTGGFSNDDE